MQHHYHHHNIMKQFAVVTALLAVAASCTTARKLAQQTSQSCNGVQHVLLISIDGLHASDLAQWTAKQPNSTLAQLQQQGIVYTNATIDGTTDSFPGLLALVTGGNVAAHNVYYDESFDRSLWPPGTSCVNGTPQGQPGTTVLFTEAADKNPLMLDGGGDSGVQSLDASKLPLNASCQPVYPHQYPQVNNIFEVVRRNGSFTAWADKHPAYDLLLGPSGTGLGDYYAPEISSFVPGSTKDWTAKANTVEQYDTLHLAAAWNWIHGLNHAGNASQPVPRLFGFNLQAVSVAQKLNTAGYNPDGTFSPDLETAMQFVDGALGPLVVALKNESLYSCTALVITAMHGQAPMNASDVSHIDPAAYINNTLTSSGIRVAHITTDTVAIIWLTDVNQTQDAVVALTHEAEALGIDELLYGDKLVQMGLVESADDPRAAQIIIKVKPGVIYTTSKKKVAEHGGLSEADKHVALLLAGPGLANTTKCLGSNISQPVYTKQVAPTVLQLLGMDPNSLEAVKAQGTKVLPGLSLDTQAAC